MLARVPRPGDKVVVGVSGGVDSSVAALLLKRRGLDVHGVFMRNWDPRDESADGRACSVTQDERDAKSVCEKIGIPFSTMDFSREYWTDVFEPFLAGLEGGATPNPDVQCNRWVKFGSFLSTVDREMRPAHGGVWIATGHYARIQRPGPARLMRAVDRMKDQTYFLSNVSRSCLEKAIFPVGSFLKSDVKKMAAEAGLLSTAERRESMGICFIGKRNFGDFISDYVPMEPGPIISLDDGRIMGRHQGLARHNLGQGARLPGEAVKWYTAAKDVKTNTLFVVPGRNHPALLKKLMLVTQWVWVDGQPPPNLKKGIRIPFTAKCKHQMEPVRCFVMMHQLDSYHVELEEPLDGLTPGQQLAIYDGDICLGGGPIASVL